MLELQSAGGADLPPLLAEQLLIEELPAWGGQRALVVSPGRAQLAGFLSNEQQISEVEAWFYDLYAATEASGLAESDVRVLCGADLPEREYDLVAMPVLMRGEAELTRELLQQAHQRLAVGGYLATSVDNPKDQWLHAQLQKMFEKVTCQRTEAGCVYWAKKTQSLKKVKDFSCQFAFRHENGRLIKALSRPGVFSHRRLDPGARQLMLSAEIGPEDSVLDLGCGAGTVALAVACQTHGAVIAVDANARAIECTQRGAVLNGLDNIACLLNADGRLELQEPVDVALANPPYFGDDRISQHFVDTAASVLRPGGALLVVTKKPSWYESYLPGQFEDIAVFDTARYFVACGRKP